MASIQKLLDQILGGRADANIAFRDLRAMLKRLGFVERIKGDHFIFTRDGVDEIINLQPLKGGKAKAYQVKQMRELLNRHRLRPPG
jgi:hypothetical protein